MLDNLNNEDCSILAHYNAILVRHSPTSTSTYYTIIIPNSDHNSLKAELFLTTSKFTAGLNYFQAALSLIATGFDGQSTCGCLVKPAVFGITNKDAVSKVHF